MIEDEGEGRPSLRVVTGGTARPRAGLEDEAAVAAFLVGDDEAAIAVLSPPDDRDGQPWTTDRLREIMKAYLTDHQALCL
ncbi:MAG TPA: hypothetical protein VML50_06455, partial [Anaeromyxobacter sp.]|nr:hypothetical protein [Anaeromyxobacter sp.]